MVRLAAVLLATMACLAARAPRSCAEPLESARAEAEDSFSLLQAPAFRRLAAASLATFPAIASGAASSEFDETPVSIPSHAGWSLRGMLAVPRGADSQTPAVVLLHMSGAFGMDENMPANLTSDGNPAKLFKQLSDTLAQAGFIVLRYDKRGVLGWDAQAETEKVDHAVYDLLTVADLTKDGAAAVRYLRSRQGASKRRVLLLGQSEGTILAPLVAKLEPVDGLILLGAAAHQLDALLRYQIVERRIGWALDMDEDKNGSLSRWETARLRRDFAMLGELADFFVCDTNGDGQLSVDEIQTTFETTLKSNPDFGTPWYLSHLELRPNHEVLPGFRGPILILQGEQDENTPASEARLLERSLRDSRHADFTVEILPGLGHAFSAPRGVLPTLGPIAPQVLPIVANWAGRRFIPRP